MFPHNCTMVNSHYSLLSQLLNPQTNIHHNCKLLNRGISPNRSLLFLQTACLDILRGVYECLLLFTNQGLIDLSQLRLLSGLCKGFKKFDEFKRIMKAIDLEWGIMKLLEKLRLYLRKLRYLRIEFPKNFNSNF